MTIDTQKNTIRVQLQKLVFLILLVLFLVLLYTTEIFTPLFPGIAPKYIGLFATLLYVLFYSWTFVRDTHYIYFNSNSSKIILRYYSVKPLSSEQNAVEVRKDEFHKAEIRESLGGLRRYLIIYQQTAKGIAKYEPISISILKKQDVDRLARELNISR